MSENIYLYLILIALLVVSNIAFILMWTRLKIKLEVINSQKDNYQEAIRTITEDVNRVAEKAVEERSERQLHVATHKIEGIVAPIKEALKSYNQEAKENLLHKEKNHGEMSALIKSATGATEILTENTRNLTSALKGESQFRGAWGELVLKRSLEISGLRENHDYSLQTTGYTDDDKRLRPDAIVHLPGKRSIIVDSKVSLRDYMAFNDSQSDIDKASYLKAHFLSLKNHVKELSEKDYTSIEGIGAFDQVLMFIPNEHALSDFSSSETQEIFELAMQKRISIVFPSTLLISLQCIESMWRSDKQVENALKIAKRGSLLIDKMTSLFEDLLKAQKYSRLADESLSGAVLKLNTGKGNLVSQAQQLIELGVKGKKSIPPSLSLENENEE